VQLLETKTGLRLKGLFTLRPFTRIVNWGKDFKHLLKYIKVNAFEAEGIDVWQRFKNKPPSNQKRACF